MLIYNVLQIVNNINYMMSINTYIYLQKSNMKPFCTPKEHIVIYFGLPEQRPFGPIHLYLIMFFSGMTIQIDKKVY